MLFLLNATALFLSSNPFFGVPTKKRRAARWDGPYKCGPWDR